MQQEQVRTARRPMRVVIVGAGIGGLAAGAILRRDGHEVTVLERAERFEPLGAGLALSPNGARALARSALAPPPTPPRFLGATVGSDERVTGS